MPRPSLAVLGGTGQQGGGIARRLVRAGYPVIVGSRDPARAAASIAEWPGAPSIASADYGDAISKADIVVLAVPFDAVDVLVDQHRSRFRQQALLVDVTVPLRFESGTVALIDLPAGSAAEHIKGRLPGHVRLAAAFKTIPAHLLTDAERPLDCDEFVCGDSPDARTQAAELVETLQGLRAVDVGPLSRARAIEHLTLLAIAINRRHKIHDARFRIVGL
jgi:NADPH-dependent F420 reductase